MGGGNQAQGGQSVQPYQQPQPAGGGFDPIGYGNQIQTSQATFDVNFLMNELYQRMKARADYDPTMGADDYQSQDVGDTFQF